jgi:CxxC-x17-CxxC domain-containing protein
VYQDKTLTCRDCSQNFVFTTGEQEFFASRGLLNEPSRCPECRAQRKQTQNGGGYSSGGYSSGGYSSGGYSSGGYSSGGYSSGGYDRPQREMFPAVCAQCGKDTQVPFQPRTDRPVYCSDCFAVQRGDSYSGGGRNRY